MVAKRSEMKKIFFFVTILLLIAAPVQSQESIVEVYVSEFTEHELRVTIEKNATGLLTEINTAFIEKRELHLDGHILSEEVHSALAEMWSSTPFFVAEPMIIQNVARLASGYYEMRNIPVYFVDPIGEKHYEDLVLQFTASGRVGELRIGLAAHRYQQLMREGRDHIDMDNRRVILSFVENFRTSYNRKDIDFIENVFSDQALIIVGRVIENTGERSAYADQLEEVEFIQFNKEEYINHLRRIFSQNEWIEVGFEEIDILRHPQYDDIYGVKLTQYYTSTIYSDVGYLFLLIDFQKPEEPMVHVRTWQPKRVTPENQRIETGDFVIL